jgi:hypothetical protein
MLFIKGFPIIQVLVSLYERGKHGKETRNGKF